MTAKEEGINEVLKKENFSTQILASITLSVSVKHILPLRNKMKACLKRENKATNNSHLTLNQ